MGNGACCTSTPRIELEEKTNFRTDDAAGEDAAPLAEVKEDVLEANLSPSPAKEEPRFVPMTQEAAPADPVDKARQLLANAAISGNLKLATEDLQTQDLRWQSYKQGEMTQKEKDFFADKLPASSVARRRPSTLDTSFDGYVAKHSAVFDKIRSWMKPDGWTLKKTVDTVDIFTKSFPGESNIFSKGTTTMKTYGNGIRHLAACMLTAEDRPKYDEVCSSGATLDSYLPYYRTVFFTIIPAVSIAAPREALTISRICFEDDGTFLLATESTEHPDKPVNSSAVRIQLTAGYVIAPTSDPDVYQVSFVACADPKGWLPGWVKNLIAWKMQLVLAKFKKFYTAEYGKGEA